MTETKFLLKLARDSYGDIDPIHGGLAVRSEAGLGKNPRFADNINDALRFDTATDALQWALKHCTDAHGTTHGLRSYAIVEVAVSIPMPVPLTIMSQQLI